MTEITYTTRPGQASSSRYIEVYAPDGQYVSRHNNFEECSESALQYAEQHELNGTYEFRTPNKEFTVRLALASGDNTPPSGSSSYTATHYVAPFASVAGASSDDDDMGAAAWTNAQSSGTPTTAGTAMRRVQPGNKVQFSGGTYTGPSGTPDTTEWEPSFYSRVNGTSENPIVFFAETPAATNPSGGASLSKLRNDGAYGKPTFGVFGFTVNGVQNIIWDGFWVSQDDQSYPVGSRGQCAISTGVNVHVRRCLFDRLDSLVPPGGQTDNYASIYSQSSLNCVISDCLFRGGISGASASHNDAAISWYGTNNLTVEYCTFEDYGAIGMGCGIFVKGTGGNSGNSGIIRYNDITPDTTGICVSINESNPNKTPSGTEIYNNLLFSGQCALEVDDSSGVDGKAFDFHHNTVLNEQQGADESGLIKWSSGVFEDQATIRDNIFAQLSPSGSSYRLCFIGVGVGLADASTNNNVYYHAAAAPTFVRGSGGGPVTYNTLGDWQTYWGGTTEDNSIFSNPEFVNAGSGDYRLASNGQSALTASSTSGPCGAYITGTEEIGIRSNPTY